MKTKTFMKIDLPLFTVLANHRTLLVLVNAKKKLKIITKTIASEANNVDFFGNLL